MPKLPNILVKDAQQNSVPFAGRYNGATVFIVGGGPSIRALDCTKLYSRGVLTFAINNVAANEVRPNLWTAGDSPHKFALSIWKDPAITKFVPEHRADSPIFDKTTPRDMPNVFTFPLASDFNSQTWLSESQVGWGLNRYHADSLGRKGVRSSFFIALKLAYFLGFRKAYLVGCDFKVKGDQFYGFDETKTPQQVTSNLHAFKVIAERFSEIRFELEEAGFEVRNCSEDSLLDVPYVPFEQALEKALNYTPQHVETLGMYDKPAPEQTKTSLNWKPRAPTLRNEPEAPKKTYINVKTFVRATK